jgi:hypothetical protein
MRNDSHNAFIASMLGRVRNGSFASISNYKRVGEEVKGVRYGDDTINALVVAGFSYTSLLERSLDILVHGDTDQILEQIATIDKATFAEAKAEVKASFEKSLRGENTSTTDHVRDPVIVDGEIIQGSWVYKCVAGTDHVCHCRTCTGDETQPAPGTIEFKGLEVWSRIIVPGQNGRRPPVKSAPLTIAKNAIKKELPISKLRQYRLASGGGWSLKAGHMALESALVDGMPETSLKVLG